MSKKRRPLVTFGQPRDVCVCGHTSVWHELMRPRRACQFCDCPRYELRNRSVAWPPPRDQEDLDRLTAPIADAILAAWDAEAPA